MKVLAFAKAAGHESIGVYCLPGAIRHAVDLRCLGYPNSFDDPYCLGRNRWQVIGPSYHGLTGLIFQLASGLGGDVASTLSAICRVDNSAKAVKISSASFMCSRRLWLLRPSLACARSPPWPARAWQQGFGSGAIGLALLAIRRGQFQLYELFVQLLRTCFLGELAFQVRPVAPGVVAVRQQLHHVNHRKPPGFGVFDVHAAHGLTVELRGQDFHICKFVNSSCCNLLAQLAHGAYWQCTGQITR